MLKYALFARLEAKPGKEGEVAKFLQAGLELAMKEAGTPVWFALKLGPTTFGIFDAFADERGRDAHLKGKLAKQIASMAPQLFAKTPEMQRVEVLADKLPH